jgi:hypothetical protein
MKRQKLINRNLGKDTHVRDHTNNIFIRSNHETVQTVVGEIIKVNPEPIQKQTIVDVKLARGGTITSVAYPGAFIDPITGNLHGTYEGPLEGQMVVVGFENGNSNTPYVVNRYPYQGTGNTSVEAKYINPLTNKGFHYNDVMIGHLSGSYVNFNTGIAPSTKPPGSITVNSISDFEVFSGTNILLDAVITAEVKSDIVKITGSTHIELNGNTDNAIYFSYMKTAYDQIVTDLNNLITAYNSHIHSGVTSGGATSGIPTVPGIPSTADMSGAKNNKVLF